MSKIQAYANKIRVEQGYQKALLFMLFAALNKAEFSRWFDVVETGAPARLKDDYKLKMIVRPSSRFLRRWMGVQQRMDILSDHYTALTNRFSKAGFDALFVNPGIEIAQITGKGGGKYPIRINGDVAKEGCIRILIGHPETGIRLASITGAFGLDEEKNRVFWVGSLQGATPLGGKQEGGKQDVSLATKDLNGLRPKQAVLHAVAAIAHWFGAKRIVAPTLKNQIAIKNFKKGQSIQTDYDGFWEDVIGVTMDKRGDYVLPLPLPRRNIEDVQQKRRKDWKLRYALIDQLASDVAAALEKI